MKKLMGVLLIFAASILYLKKERDAYQYQCNMVQDILSALENMATAIRWEKQPLSVSIAAQINREYAGKYFSRIYQDMQSKKPLQYIWESNFSKIQPKEISKFLTSITLGGDITNILSQMALTSDQIRKFQEEEKARRAEKWRLKIAVTLSFAGVTAIMFL